ncbi:MAG TPA: PPOX class F420-dependent oxidoreductase [Candidatus Nitrosocosmicus sp.]|nr:PPOX class F420-dependent oxidoreductase [Candidatus Nitrosocosmicus sp.]
MIFTDKEKEYIGSQVIARIATTNCQINKREKSGATKGLRKSQPDVVPVGFDFDGDCFYIGGMNLFKSLKYKNAIKNNNVAIVIDDLETINPWKPRGIRIYGIADLVNREGGYMSYIDQSKSQSQLPYLRVRPTKKWSWGIESPVFVWGKFEVERASLNK